ncbi:MAG: guanylate kinase [Lachnospiraceae bacterium]|jgi:guanylate kinase|nr:guanylate kinase [Lachnospiraceae bacterium]SDA54507.1 guanylate kinase [Lachnospiraceae bacterium G11]
MSKPRGILIVISGFSGAGKGTVVNELVKDKDAYALSISMTTRAPRPGDAEGVTYFFVSREKFEETIEAGGLLEYAQYCDNYYGTPKAYVESQLAQGKNVILEIEIQGALKIKEQFDDAVLFFITPPSIAELERRLRSRGTETEEVIKKRIERAAEEAKGIENYDYLIINDKLDECVSNIKNVVAAAKTAPKRNRQFIGELRDELGTCLKGE